jgi:hypothetical protein
MLPGVASIAGFLVAAEPVPRQSISFVGSGTTTTVGTSGGSFDFGALVDESGGTPALQEGDLVLVTISRAHTGTVASMGTIGGYAEAFSAPIYSSESDDTSLQVFYKFIGAMPDTTIAIPAASASTDTQCIAVHVLRGVDGESPFDATGTSAIGGNGGNPDPPAITPATAGAWIYLAGGMATDSTIAAPAEMSPPAGTSTIANHFRTTSETGATRRSAIAAGVKTDWIFGLFDAGAFSSGNTNVRQSWAAAKLALRPAPLAGN